MAHKLTLIDHNPAGAASVLAMMSFLLVQVATGLVGLLEQPAPECRDTTGTRLLALAVLAACSAAVAWLVSLGR